MSLNSCPQCYFLPNFTKNRNFSGHYPSDRQVGAPSLGTSAPFPCAALRLGRTSLPRLGLRVLSPSLSALLFSPSLFLLLAPPSLRRSTPSGSFRTGGQTHIRKQPFHLPRGNNFSRIWEVGKHFANGQRSPLPPRPAGSAHRGRGFPVEGSLQVSPLDRAGCFPGGPLGGACVPVGVTALSRRNCLLAASALGWTATWRNGSPSLQTPFQFCCAWVPGSGG